MTLDAFDSAITYRAHYQRRFEVAALLDLVVIDGANPRSLACCVTTLRAELARLPQAGSHDLAALLPDPASWKLEELIGADEDAALPQLMDLSLSLIDIARQLSDELGELYFSHAGEIEHSVLR